VTDKAPAPPPAGAPRARRRTQAPIEPPIFPRSTPTYVGRATEVKRAVELAADETLHLVYGVGGVGKSELVFRIVEELRKDPRWTEARALLVDARPGMTAEHLVASLGAVAGARGARTKLGTGGTSSLDDDLALAARALERAPALVFIDNLHQLDPVQAGNVLGYLSRRVRGSRLFAASQVELVLPADSPPPIIYRLGPLDRSDTAALVERLAERLDQPPPDPGGVYDRTGGSPFLVLRDLAGDRGGERSALDHTLRELDPAARSLLGALAVARTPITVEEATGAVGTEAVRELARRFLVDAGRDNVMIHDLIRDAVGRTASRRDVAAAHRLLAELYGARGEHTGRGPDPIDLVEMVHHLLRSGDAEEAWEVCQRAYRSVGGAGLDHLLIDDLRTLASELPAARASITLLSVRILVRRSLIAEAAELLSTLGTTETGTARWNLLAGEIAHRRGRMSEADAHFRRAHEIATERGEKLQAAAAVADVASLRGRNADARVVLAEVARLHAPLAPRERARWGWSLALTYLIEERFAASVVAARAASDAIAGMGLDDLDGLLAMLELIGRCECDDIAGARALVDRTGPRAIQTGALRETVLAGYRGVIDYHAGDLQIAVGALERGFAHLTAHADHTLASIAGYYLTRAQLARGEITAAIAAASAIVRAATAAELDTLAPHGRAALAEALLEANRIAEARAAAETALAAPRRSDQTAWMSTVLLARIAAADGDIGLARRMLAAAEAGGLEDWDKGDVDTDHGVPPITPGLEPSEIGLDPATIDDSGPDAATIFSAGIAARAAALAIEGAWVELLGGDPAGAAAKASAALAHYAATGRRGLEARAAVIRALALIARGGDRTEATALIDRAAELAEPSGHARVMALVGLARAALAARRGAVPSSAVAGIAPDLRHTEGRALAAALAEVEPASGLRALLSSLGLVSGLRYRVLGRGGTRVIGDTELERLRTAHRLVVEPSRAAITATVNNDIRVDRGRPLACELLAALVEAQGGVVPAETLFLSVWGGREYHPLRHRNTLYVAIKRLRTTLRDLLGEEREIVETAAGGWRLADGIDAIVIRPLDDGRGDNGKGDNGRGGGGGGGGGAADPAQDA
jgi:tetratricopeptide (TPR) repeat protein